MKNVKGFFISTSGVYFGKPWNGWTIQRAYIFLSDLSCYERKDKLKISKRFYSLNIKHVT